MRKQSPQVLLVDDNPADVDLVREASAGGGYQCNLHNEADGEKALAYMRRVREGRAEGGGNRGQEFPRHTISGSLKSKFV